MTDVSGARSAAGVFGRGVLFVLGWHALLVAAFVVFVMEGPPTHLSGCEGLGFGCTPNARDSAVIIGVLFGIPALAASFLVAVAITGIVAGGVRTGLAAGTIGALSAWLVAAILLCLWAQSHA